MHTAGMMLAVSALTGLSGCVTPAMEPAVNGQILSRLAPSAASGVAAAVSLTPQEKARYDQIDRQVLREQANRRPVVVYGSAPGYTVVPAISYYGYYPGYSYGYPYGYGGWGWYPGFSFANPSVSFSVIGGW